MPPSGSFMPPSAVSKDIFYKSICVSITSFAAFSDVQKYVNIKSFRGSDPDPTASHCMGKLTALPRPPSWWKGAGCWHCPSQEPLSALGPSDLEHRSFWPRSPVPPSRNCLRGYGRVHCRPSDLCDKVLWRLQWTMNRLVLLTTEIVTVLMNKLTTLATRH